LSPLPAFPVLEYAQWVVSLPSLAWCERICCSLRISHGNCRMFGSPEVGLEADL